MLFNSYPFLFVFLPVTLAVYYVLGRRGPRPVALGWLAIASFAFYAYWKPAYLVLLLASIGLNYAIGLAIERRRLTSARSAKLLLIAGVALDLGALGFFKYTDFILSTVNGFAGTALPVPAIVLPLAISFFTFNQIAYLADVHAGVAEEHGFLEYCLFVSFFPHLIAGPIVHHKEMMPQFRSISLRYDPQNMAVGSTIFAVGLFKKVALADRVAPYADKAFLAASQHVLLSPPEAWVAALAYTLQLYLDFSGYSEMAIGLARMFGIEFPANFFSPYRANDIGEFWQRWHMTLSRFLRDYLYIPLGGNRKGTPRRYANLMITMLLGGLWHGAAWHFVLWGGLHGGYLVAHQGWKKFSRVRIPERFITFVAVVFAWVAFRADNIPATLSIWRSMLDPRRLSGGLFPHVAIAHADLAFIALLLAAIFLLPNVHQLMGARQHSVGADAWIEREPMRIKTRWAPTPRWAIAGGCIAGAGVILSMASHTFLYFQF